MMMKEALRTSKRDIENAIQIVQSSISRFKFGSDASGFYIASMLRNNYEPLMKTLLEIQNKESFVEMNEMDNLPIIEIKG